MCLSCVPKIAAKAIEWMSAQINNYVYNPFPKSSWGVWGSFFQEVPHKRKKLFWVVVPKQPRELLKERAYR